MVVSATDRFRHLASQPFRSSPIPRRPPAPRRAGCERGITAAVLDEIRRGEADHPLLAEIERLQWLEHLRADSLPALQVFAGYTQRLGSGDRDIGEASTLAWAELNHAIAIVDDRVATRIGRDRGVEVHGTLWLVTRGLRRGVIGREEAPPLIDALRHTEAWFPCSGDDFLRWADENGLLDPP